MKKWLATATVCVVTLCAGMTFVPTPAEAADSQVAQAAVNDVRYMNLSSGAKVVDNQVYLPLRSTFSDMFMALDWRVDGTDLVRITNAYESYDLYLGDGGTTLKLQEWGYGYPIQSIDGCSYVPMNFFDDIIANYNIGMSGDNLMVLMANGSQVPSFWHNMNATPVKEVVAEPAPQATVDGTSPAAPLEPMPEFTPGVSIAGTGQLAMPTVAGAILTSPFGYREDPFGGDKKDFHLGMDLAAAKGSPIYAAEGGTIVRASWFESYGNCIDVQHPNGMLTRYAHLDGFNVALGQEVGCGQTIGTMGATGAATGPHLHFEVYVDGERVNPASYVGL